MNLSKITTAFLLLLNSCSNNQQVDKKQNQQTKIDKPIVTLSKEIEPLDKSPIDIAWFPENYPLEKIKKTIQGEPLIRLIYSRPHLQGRIVGKDVAMPDTLWRMGANENNEIEFFKDVNISGKKIAKGKYIIYCMPHKNNWDIFLSNDINTWGLKLDTSKVLLKTNVPLQQNNDIIESLTMQFVKNDKNVVLEFYWGDAKCELKIEL